MAVTLEFEKPIAELESKLAELRHLSSSGEVNIVSEVKRLQEKAEKLLKKSYQNLTPWQKVLVARHPERPHTSDYIKALITDFTPLAGDRTFGEDAAIIGGLGKFRGHPVVVMGHEKGKDTELRLKHNFGMPRPEGYRKAARLMQLADRFNLPIITFIDTAGAHPAIEAEERGQSEAIARSLEVSAAIHVPIITTVIGEGGSGGAVALAFANVVLMLEHAIYSVISPEGCASILWRTRDKKEEAAAAQKLTAQDLKQLGVIDAIIPEPLGGAQRGPSITIQAVGDAIEKALKPLLFLDRKAVREQRRAKFLAMGRAGITK
ncbi:MAG TPA: acetyl-CoA carboxylase carboxyltransferase subunit alpha [Alphaproteobacteria bacterium]|nr:acetyl-CoA carboxylase carboxyltransferase subunit alpha [Alphaproteobacteria bacterium]